MMNNLFDTDEEETQGTPVVQLKKHSLSKNEINVKPSDSASNVSLSSNASNLSEARIIEAAKRAALEAEQAELESTMKIRMEMEQQQIKIKLAKIAARERVLQEAGVPLPGTSNVGKNVSQPNVSWSQSNAVSDRLKPSSSQIKYEKVEQSPNDYDTIQDYINARGNPNDSNLTEFFNEQRKYLSLLSLPQITMPTFEGNFTDYHEFIRAFDAIIASKECDALRLFFYLEHFTKGHAHKLVRSCRLMHPSLGYKTARELLSKKYDHAFPVVMKGLDDLTKGPPIQNNDLTGLDDYSVDITECKTLMSSLGYENRLSSPDILQQIVKRLPYKLQESWRHQADVLTYVLKKDITITHIEEFLNTKVREMSHPIFGQLSVSNTKKNKHDSNSKSYKKSSFVTQTESSPQTTGETSKSMRNLQRQCKLCDNPHFLDDCERFKNMDQTKRFNFVRENKLCFSCLKPNHMLNECRNATKCGIENCKALHHRLLHRFKLKLKVHEDSSSDKNAANEDDEVETRRCGKVDVHKEGKQNEVAMAIVPVHVRIQGTSKSIVTNAFLDSGSNVSFTSKRLMEKLNAKGHNVSFKLTTMNENSTLCDSTLLRNLEVADIGQNKFYAMSEVFSRSVIPISKEEIIKKADLCYWPHLSEVPLVDVDAEVDLLISSNDPKLLEPIECIPSKNNSPFATRTALGWVLNGPLRRNRSKNGCKTFFIKRDAKALCDLCTDLMTDSKSSKKEMSIEDMKFLENARSSIKHLENKHYEIRLPLKNEAVSMPDNYVGALRRAENLKCRFKKDSEFFRKYKENIDMLVENGYATKLSDAQVNESGSKWYLPHHAVFNAKKPDKVRIVFDASARFHGVCLNDILIQGPDLTNNLVGVLTRFRKERIALMSDIKQMFHQVYIPSSQYNLMRFLWWSDGDLQKPPDVYCMKVYIFGTVTSPSSVNFALRQTAEDQKINFPPEVTNTVLRNFYVDDCLVSVPSKEKAIDMMNNLRSLLQCGGFELTKWSSNSKEVVKKIPEADRSNAVKELCFDERQRNMERALGVHWCVESDCFKFKISIVDKPMTRRGILSMILSTYDPLGMILPVMVVSKLLMQHMCYTGIGWDEKIPMSYIPKWTAWFDDLQLLTCFNMQRCLKPPNFGRIVECEVHIFSDASNSAMCAVSYLRMKNDREEVYCTFLLAKSRLAPKKPMTIPRLELCAATLAIKINNVIKDELDMNVTRTCFWSDSTTALSYIKNEQAHFHTYVANRVGFIRDHSDVLQWHYVATNPADLATRGLQAEDFLSQTIWLNGPDFLWEKDISYRINNENYSLCVGDKEVKTTNCFATCASEVTSFYESILKKFSSWFKAKRVITWMLLYCASLKKCTTCKEFKSKVRESYLSKVKLNLPQLSVENLKDSEVTIVNAIQREFFDKEFKLLQKNKGVSKQSSIARLDPFIDTNGVMKVGGRLKHGSFEPSMKHQMIIPQRSTLSELIIRDIHESSNHTGRMYVLSVLREKYWIPQANSAVRKCLKNCMPCRKRFSKPCGQKMSDLPQERLKTDDPPFTYVGIDCFGPFEVKRGRCVYKRYGLILTCLTTRAIHIEVLHSMDTDSFIMGLRRFIARRGQVKFICSDNGSNFTSAEAELRKSIKQLDECKINTDLMKMQIEWRFNPPFGSHFGGVWERCIRTVRRILKSVLNEQTLTDESLITMMCEVEYIINNRPLTTVSSDPNDLHPITPNSLLLLKNEYVMPPGVFNEKDTYSRRRWRQIQYLADVFWSRWKKEYVATLQQRKKWLRPQANLKEDDVVLVVDDQLKRNDWLLGRVVTVYKDSNNLVRQATVKTIRGLFRRPVTKLCLLVE